MTHHPHKLDNSARPVGLLFSSVLLLGIVLAPGGAEAFRCDSTLNPAGASGALDNGTALSTACGTNVRAQAAGAVALGTDTDNSGIGTSAAGANSTAIGGDAFASGTGSTAVGADNGANLNAGARATGIRATAVGADAEARTTDTTALGAQAIASGSQATAIGMQSIASAARSTTVGFVAGPLTGSEGLTAVGANAGVQGMGRYSSALGAGSLTANGPTASGDYSIAIGGGDGGAANGAAIVGAKASGLASTAVGGAARALAAGSSAFGVDSRARDTAALALGRKTRANKRGAVAIGNKAIAEQRGSVAIGEDSIATKANTVSVGGPGKTRRIMRVAPAVNSTDAVNLGQAKALVAAATGGSSLYSPIRHAKKALRRELSELRTMVRLQQVLLDRQQQRIDRLEGHIGSAAEGSGRRAQPRTAAIGNGDVQPASEDAASTSDGT